MKDFEAATRRWFTIVLGYRARHSQTMSTTTTSMRNRSIDHLNQLLFKRLMGGRKA